MGLQSYVFGNIQAAQGRTLLLRRPPTIHKFNIFTKNNHKKAVADPIRTDASEENRFLVCRIRPLCHSNWVN